MGSFTQVSRTGYIQVIPGSWGVWRSLQKTRAVVDTVHQDDDAMDEAVK
jgi:hypothetical protein